MQLIKTNKYLKYLGIPDIVNQLFLLFLTLIILLNHEKFKEWYIVLAVNAAISFFIFFIVYIYEIRTRLNRKVSPVIRILRFWYSIFIILFFFKEIYLIMVNLKPVYYDELLIKADYFIFGFNPTQAVHFIANPFLTEFLQIIYTMFYIIPVIYGLELYLWKRYDEFKYAMFVIFLGFYLTFIGYMILPAIGPRFTLHEFGSINIEVPGLMFTNLLREIVNIGESVPKGTPFPELSAQRDAFPSSHTVIVLLIAYLSHKIKSKSFYFYFPYSLLVIFSTIYLRYHYVVDIIAGVFISIVTILITNLLYGSRFHENVKIANSKKQE
jgi:membrane-associated phospholipid phosphatase